MIEERKTGGSLKVGDRVKVIGVPPDAHNDLGLETRTLLEKCVGKTFTIVGLEAVEGLPYHLAQLEVGQILGRAPYLESIWLEPEYLQLEEPE